MLYKLILLQICAHLLADYLFQPPAWSKVKEKGVFTFHHFYHILVVFAFSWALSLDQQFWVAAYIISVIHLLTDMFKSFLQIRYRRKYLHMLEMGTPLKKKYFFFLDQFIHLVTIVVVCYYYDVFYEIKFLIALPLKTIAIITTFVFCAKPANIIIRFILIYFEVEFPDKQQYSDDPDVMVDEEPRLPNAGKLIGVMERFLTLALILIGQFSAVGLIIAAKSILRFRNTQRNEYILVGTLLSFGMAAILGIVIWKLL